MVTTWGQRVKTPLAASSYQLGDVKGRMFDKRSQFRFTRLASGHTDSNPACAYVVFHYALPHLFFSSVQFNRSVVSDSLWPHGLQHSRPLCLSPTPGVYPNSCPLSRWCHQTNSSSVLLFSSCPLFPNIRVFSNESALCIRWPEYWSLSFSISPSMNIQDGFPLAWTGWISLLSKGLSRVCNTTVQKHQFFGAESSLGSNSHIHTWLLEKP